MGVVFGGEAAWQRSFALLQRAEARFRSLDTVSNPSNRAPFGCGGRGYLRCGTGKIAGTFVIRGGRGSAV